MTFVTRAQSGLPGPTDGMFVPGGVKTKFVVHWDGGRNPRDYADEIALLRSYIAHHFAQGWAGPAYNLAVGPITGYEYELRGLGAVGTPFSRISFTQASRPAVLTGQAEEDSEADTSYRYVLMPVRFAS